MKDKELGHAALSPSPARILNQITPGSESPNSTRANVALTSECVLQLLDPFWAELLAAPNGIAGEHGLDLRSSGLHVGIDLVEVETCSERPLLARSGRIRLREKPGELGSEETAAFEAYSLQS